MDTMARPTIYTDELANAIVADLLDGAPVTAAVESKISRETYYAWRATRPAFSDMVDAARAQAHLIRSKEVSAFVRGEHPDNANFHALQFWLKTQRPDAWREQTEVKHSGHIGLGDLIRATSDAGKNNTTEGDAQAQHADNIEEPV
jgi:hypothetical protein